MPPEPSPRGRPEFLTTLHYPRRAEWVRRGECLTTDTPAAPVRFARALARARRGQPVVLNGFSTADLLAGMTLARLRRNVPVVVVDCTWQRGRSWWDRLVTRVGVGLLAGRLTTFCVSSEAEAACWPAQWGVSPDRLVVLHWHHGVDELEQEVCEGDGSIFAGGHALRDYATLVAAAAHLNAPVTIAARAKVLPPEASIPPHVTVGEVSRAQFHRRLATASAVVVPIVAGEQRSAGQTTYLDAMALGGLVVVSDTIGVREYIEHGRTGLLFPAGDARALAETLGWALDPRNADEVRSMRTAARRTARDHFSPDTFISTMLGAIVGSAQVPKTRS